MVKKITKIKITISSMIVRLKFKKGMEQGRGKDGKVEKKDDEDEEERQWRRDRDEESARHKA